MPHRGLWEQGMGLGHPEFCPHVSRLVRPSQPACSGGPGLLMAVVKARVPQTPKTMFLCQNKAGQGTQATGEGHRLLGAGLQGVRCGHFSHC